MKYVVLFNSAAANGRGEEQAKEIVNVLPGADLGFSDLRTIEDFDAFFAGYEAGTAFVLAGGDGTLNHFVNTASESALTYPIYYYACGSGNDFGKDIGLEDHAAPMQINKYLVDLPTVTVKGKDYKFLNNVGFGIDGYCCEIGDKIRATSDKAIDYTSIAIKGLLHAFKPTSATVTVDGISHRFEKVWLAPTMNGRFYGGGMQPTPAQDRLDPENKVSVMLFHNVGRLRALMLFPSIFEGKHLKHDSVVSVFSGKTVHVVFDTPCALQIDGETILGVTEYTVSTNQN